MDDRIEPTYLSNSTIGDQEFTSAGLTRRDFVRSAVAAGLLAGTGTSAWGAETRTGDMIYRQLGRTGEKVSALGLGGYHIGNPEEQEGIAIIRKAIDGG